MALAAQTTDTHFGFDGSSNNHHWKMLHKLKRDMEARGCKLLLHSGDWSTFRQRQFYRTLQMFREILGPDIVIAAVKGNHCHWQDTAEGERETLEEMLAKHLEWFREFGVVYLDGRTEPFMFEDVAIVGFDGWYGSIESARSRTNDALWLPKQVPEGYVDAHDFMQKRAYCSLSRLYALDYGTPRKVVGLSHFPLYEVENDHCGNPSWMPHLASICDIVCFGHSHKQINGLTVGDGCTVYNAGSDYGKIRYLIIDI